jgi:hypothetical protein
MRLRVWRVCAIVTLMGWSVALSEIQSSESWTILDDEGYVVGGPGGSYAAAVSDGEDDWVTAGAMGSMSVWTTVDARLDWEYFIRVEGRADVFIRDNQFCEAAGIADASAEGPENSDSLQAAAVVWEDQNGSWYDHDDGGEPDGIWKHNPDGDPWRFFADEGVSASHDVGVLASAPLESNDRASAWAVAEAWCDLYVP